MKNRAIFEIDTETIAETRDYDRLIKKTNMFLTMFSKEIDDFCVKLIDEFLIECFECFLTR